MRTNGYKPPRYESEARIKSFITSNGIDESKVVYLKDLTENKKALRLFNNSPGIIIADSNLKRLNFQNKKENCAAPVENLLMNLCEIKSDEVYYRDSNLIALSTMSGLSNSLKNQAGKTHYIFFLWNCTMGKNIKKIKAWENILNEHAHCNFQTFWINCDYMANWYDVKPGKKIRYQFERR